MAATLKCLHSRNSDVEWYPGLTRISVIDSWSVDPKDRGRVVEAYREGNRAYEQEHNVNSPRWPDRIEVANFDYPWDDIDADDNEPMFLQMVLCERGPDDVFGVIVEHGETFLMGDDGGTIDRL